MKPVGRLLLIPFALVALAACAPIQEGTVVAKRFRPEEAEFQRLGPTWTLEVEGTTTAGKPARRTILVNEDEWSRLEVGDRYSTARRARPPRKARETETAVATQKTRPAEENLFTRVTEMFERDKPDQTASKPAARKAAASRTKKRAAAAKQRATEKAAARTASKPQPSPQPAASPTPTATATVTPSPAPTKTATPTPSPKPTKELSYEQAATKAAEDRKVRELKQKIHAARSDEEQLKAANDYYKSLYGRMRELAPSAKDRIDKEEAAKVQR